MHAGVMCLQVCREIMRDAQEDCAVLMASLLGSLTPFIFHTCQHFPPPHRPHSWSRLFCMRLSWAGLPSPTRPGSGLSSSVPGARGWAPSCRRA